MNTSNNPQGIAGAVSVEDRLTSWLSGEPGEQPEAETEDQPEALAESAEAQSEASEDETPEPEAKAEEDGAEEAEDPEQADESDADEGGEEQLVTVKVNGKTEKLPLNEVVQGYQRLQDYTRKTQELGEARREHEAEVEAVSTERQQYAQLLQALSQQLQTQMQAEPDWDALYEQNPAAYVREKARWDDMKERQQAAYAEMQRVSQAQAQQNQQRMHQVLSSEREELFRAIPQWKDEKAFDAGRKKIRDYGKSLGFSEEELSQVFDHRAVLALWKASQYDELTSNRPEARKGQSPTAKAGSARNAPSQASQYKKARQRLAKSGSLEDAAALMQSLI